MRGRLLSIDGRRQTRTSKDDQVVQASGAQGALRWSDDQTGLAAACAKLRDILALLDRSRRPEEMDLPGFGLHPLRGDLKGHWGRIGLRQVASNFQI